MTNSKIKRIKRTKQEKKQKTNLLLLGLCVLLPFIVGYFGSSVTMSSIPNWYSSLNKPFFSPPNWLFAPAWTLLYVLMGISLYLVLSEGIKRYEVRFASIIYGIQLFLNGIWSYAFFYYRSPLSGLVVISMLWISILMTMNEFSKINKISARILIPYIAWVSFASVLNLAILLLN